MFPLLFSVLQLRLQQRRTREQLVEQGIMPREYQHCQLSITHKRLMWCERVYDIWFLSRLFVFVLLWSCAETCALMKMLCVAALKSPAAFHGQIRSLERARVRHPVLELSANCGLEKQRKSSHSNEQKRTEHYRAWILRGTIKYWITLKIAPFITKCLKSPQKGLMYHIPLSYILFKSSFFCF